MSPAGSPLVRPGDTWVTILDDENGSRISYRPSRATFNWSWFGVAAVIGLHLCGAAIILLGISGYLWLAPAPPPEQRQVFEWAEIRGPLTAFGAVLLLLSLPFAVGLLRSLGTTTITITHSVIEVAAPLLRWTCTLVELESVQLGYRQNGMNDAESTVTLSLTRCRGRRRQRRTVGDNLRQPFRQELFEILRARLLTAGYRGGVSRAS